MATLADHAIASPIKARPNDETPPQGQRRCQCLGRRCSLSMSDQMTNDAATTATRMRLIGCCVGAASVLGRVSQVGVRGSVWCRRRSGRWRAQRREQSRGRKTPEFRQ